MSADDGAAASSPAAKRAALALMAASGFAGLGYQIVWTQQSAVWLGHEAAAVLAVVAAFFGGLAVGALALGARIEASARPARWYAGCEIAIAAWSVVLAIALPHIGGALLGITGAEPSPVWQWTVAFCGTFVVLLPATAAMGATLPAMERVTAGWPRGGRSIAALYASNTFGATLGVLAIALYLVPELGLARTAGVCAALNLLCGIGSLLVFPRRVFPRSSAPTANTPREPGRRRAVLLRLAATGFLGIGYEVLVARVLAEVAEDTVYTFAMLLAVYLVGTAAGAGADRRVQRADAANGVDGLLGALAAACLVGTASLWAAEHVRAFALEVLGSGMSAAVGAEAVLAIAAFGPPTVIMGALFGRLAARANAAGATFGQAFGVNTLGAAAAPLVFGVLALPALGPKVALLGVALGYLALTTPRAWRTVATLAPAAAALAMAVVLPRLAFVDVPDGGHVLSYEDGVMAAVSVVEDAGGIATLRIDNRAQEGSNATRRVDSRQAWLPLLLHPAPQRALFLGLGTGVTAVAAAADPTLAVDAVELLPEVIAASTHFVESAGNARRPRVVAADARRFVRASAQRYDVIVSDNFHPARSGSGALYTVEHFAAVRARLENDGVFCQWLPLHQLDLATLRSIAASFLAVFPHGTALLASNSLDTPVVGLVGRADDGRFDLDALSVRLASAALPRELAAIGLEDELALLGSFVAGHDALRRFAGDADLNTDDRPVVVYRAPRITYAPTSSPRDRLTSLLRELKIAPGELLADVADERVQRLAAYWTARDVFIESGRNVQPSGDVEDMLRQVRAPLLTVLKISPDFRPAYDPLLMMANALAHTDVSAARALLTELANAQPARPEATLALRELGVPPR